MYSIDLIILGYLMHGEKSAYEMVKEFETWDLKYWIKISNASIYKKIIKLSKDGYLDSRTIKEGEMPEKTIYSINKKGDDYFKKLMEMSSSNFSNIYFDFSSFIVNLHNINKADRHRMLKNFNNVIKTTSEYLSNSLKENHKDLKELNENAFNLTELYEDLYKLLNNWSSKLLDKY